jgi:hypothetical protein
MVPNGDIVTVLIEHSNDITFSTGVDTLATKAYTGAGGAGVPAIYLRASLPKETHQYIRATVIQGASTADMSSLSATLCLVR